MNKKLPKVFSDSSNKYSGNNERVSYSSLDKPSLKEERKSSNVDTNVKNINQKINDIFTSTNYVYKADVLISLRNENITARIVGRNSTHLITIENKLIPISDIVDIERII